MTPRVDHIQITVRDFEESEQFYDRLMPILGFDLEQKGSGYVAANDFQVVEYVHENVVIGINSPRESVAKDPVHRRRPGSLHHLAFRARSREEVDEAYEQIRSIGALIVHAPQLFPQHGESYYACFFKDPSGIKLEVMHEGTSVSDE